MDEVRPLCHAFENICCIFHCHLPSTDLDPSCPSADSWCASPTGGDGRWGSRERERGCSRRLSDQPSRHRLRRRLASPCGRVSCCPRRMAIVHSILAGVTTAVVSVRACEHRRPRGEPARRSSSARAALAGRDGAGNRGVWGWRAPPRGRTMQWWSTVPTVPRWVCRMYTSHLSRQDEARSSRRINDQGDQTAHQAVPYASGRISLTAFH